MIDEANILIDGKEYQDFTDVVVTKSIETLSGTFKFETTSSKLIDFPIKAFSKCQILVSNTQVLNGYVEKIAVTYSGGDTHNITVSGRDRTGDVEDSTVGSKNSKYEPPISLKSFAERVLKSLNLSDIKVIENTSIPQFVKSDSSLTAEYGKSAFDYLQQYAHKRQVLITTDGDGNILFMRSPSQMYKTHLILSKDASATILGATINYDTTKIFHEYNCITQGNPAGADQNFVNPIKTAGVKSSPIFDNEIRNSRIYNFEADFNTSQETIKKRTQWEANFRRSQMKKWTYTVKNFLAEDDKIIWKPGYLVKVRDEFADTDSILLISSVAYHKNIGQGTRTVLKLVNKDSFSLIVNKPAKNKQENVEGDQQYFSIPIADIRKLTKTGVV